MGKTTKTQCRSVTSKTSASSQSLCERHFGISLDQGTPVFIGEYHAPGILDLQSYRRICAFSIGGPAELGRQIDLQ